jgi:hypothetical protein
MTALAKPYTGRKEAGGAVTKEILTRVQLQQEGEVHLATIGEFDLVFDGERVGKEGSITRPPFSARALTTTRLTSPSR